LRSASLFRNLDGLSQARREARMRIEDYMTDTDVKLSMPNNLTPEQEALWQQAFAAGNRAFEALELNEKDQLRWKYQRYIKSYIASVRSMDRQIGRMLDFLEANKLMENTIVIYSSDQGFYLGENGWFDKRWMDEVSPGAAVNAVARTYCPGTSSDALVQNIDFAPRCWPPPGEAKNAHARRQPSAIAGADASRPEPGIATCTTTSTKKRLSRRTPTACAQRATTGGHYQVTVGVIRPANRPGRSGESTVNRVR
jgi:hypothetical protein